MNNTRRSRGNWLAAAHLAVLDEEVLPLREHSSRLYIGQKEWREWRVQRPGQSGQSAFAAKIEYREFLQLCPEFERMLLRSEIILLRYLLLAGEEGQGPRFQDRLRIRPNA